MLCTDIEIDAGLPERAFVKAWNLIFSHRMRYIASFKNLASTTNDLLLKYKAEEFIRLLEAIGAINIFDYDFSLKVLEHIEVCDNGRLSVVFLTGTRIAV